MNQEEFIDGLKWNRNGSIKAAIRALVSPPGRRPTKKEQRLSSFYNGLSESDQKNIRDIVEYSINGAIFSFLCILDHVGFIEDDEEKTRFELYAMKNGERVLLNDENQEMLHDIFNDWAGVDED